ncbi:MAG TPA: MFS transporter [Steroidobacteraceae bacterium]|nr:MFS transporter [Steroidobacteraceae bacterium]
MNDAAATQAAPGLNRRMLLIMCAAAAVLMVTMGMRQSLGLYIAPIIESTHVGYAAMSFALAVGQLMWGVAQPVFGALADRHGSRPVLIAGALLLAGGTALTPFASGEFTLLLTIGVLTAAGAGAGSFSVLIGVVAQRVPADRRSFAAGFVNAGGSLGQFVFAPLNQLLIASFGWMAAMWSMTLAALATIPIAGPLLVRRSAHEARATSVGGPAPSALTMREQLAIASRDRSYWCLHAGFFTCGFHISFLVTHLPGEVKLCSLPASVAAGSLAIIGLANVAGSLMAGWAGGVMRMKWLLFAMYFSRAVAVALYLAAPKTALTFYLFAAVLGFTWLATVPPTAGLIGKLFGVRYLATLFGLATFTHQIGGFFGAWLGGRALTAFGDFSWMWYADIALALAAAFINLPIREAPILRAAPAGAAFRSGRQA